MSYIGVNPTIPVNITDNELAVDAVVLSGTKVTGVLPVAKGGTGTTIATPPPIGSTLYLYSLYGAL